MQHTITKEQFYKAPIRKVWEAITDEQQISAWFIKADFKAEVGYEYTFTHEQTMVTGEVTEVEPLHRLVYTWIVGETTAVTTVQWLLAEEDGGTLVTIIHSGFENYPDDTVSSMFTSSQKGWDVVLNELEDYLKTEKYG